MEEGKARDVMDICTNTCKKHTRNQQQVARAIKEVLDEAYGATWHVVVGEGFGFDGGSPARAGLVAQVRNLLYSL